jgi:cytoskeletal protein CcmA (bactofilin family)
VSKIHEEVKSAEQFRRGSHILAGLRITGQISGNEDLTVDGNVEGPIQLADGALTVGGKGTVKGDVAVRELVVHGTVTGDLQARDRLEIKASGSVVGDVMTSRIVIDDGAHYKGSIEIGWKDDSQKK